MMNGHEGRTRWSGLRIGERVVSEVYYDSMRETLKQAEQRIAELEAALIELSLASDMVAYTECPSNADAEQYNRAWTRAKELIELAAAGKEKP